MVAMKILRNNDEISNTISTEKSGKDDDVIMFILLTTTMLIQVMMIVIIEKKWKDDNNENGYKFENENENNGNEASSGRTDIKRYNHGDDKHNDRMWVKIQLSCCLP